MSCLSPRKAHSSLYDLCGSNLNSLEIATKYSQEVFRIFAQLGVYAKIINKAKLHSGQLSSDLTASLTQAKACSQNRPQGGSIKSLEAEEISETEEISEAGEEGAKRLVNWFCAPGFSRFYRFLRLSFSL